LDASDSKTTKQHSALTTLELQHRLVVDAGEVDD
jgi:hypothetical protein